MSEYIATSPISTKELREYAYRIRKEFNCLDTLTFPVLDVIDQLIDYDLLSLLIVDDNDEIFN